MHETFLDTNSKIMEVGFLRHWNYIENQYVNKASE
jgi:hypothetical protein